MLDPSLQPASRDIDGGEQLELGVQLGVGGGDVLVLVLPQLPLHSLLGHPVFVLQLVEGGVVGARGRLLVRPPVIAGSAIRGRHPGWPDA